MVHQHRDRSLLGLSLMVAQAFFYNAIFFTYALLLVRFYKVPAARVGYYLLPFALGNVLGPLLIGRLFDTVGRKRMIIATYGSSGQPPAPPARPTSRSAKFFPSKSAPSPSPSFTPRARSQAA
jgi:MFS family permease